MGIQSYRDLEVWRKAMDLAVSCYRATEALPASEAYGLSSQIRRASTSVAANIAEGRGRRTTGDFLRFIDIAYGSLVEVETLVILGNRLEQLDEHRLHGILDATAEIGRMLNGLRTSLSRRSAERGARRRAVPPESRIPNPES